MLEAVKELREYDHAFITPDGVRYLGEPFGVYKTETETDRRTEFKGLNTGLGHKEGDKVEGLAAHKLAMAICEKLNVPFRETFGIGTQLQVCCDAIEKHLTEK